MPFYNVNDYQQAICSQAAYDQEEMDGHLDGETEIIIFDDCDCALETDLEAYRCVFIENWWKAYRKGEMKLSKLSDRLHAASLFTQYDVSQELDWLNTILMLEEIQEYKDKFCSHCGGYKENKGCYCDSCKDKALNEIRSELAQSTPDEDNQ